MPKKTKETPTQQRSMRMQQIVAGVFAVIIVFTMILSLVANY